ncbi:MAG TPA: NADP-dependent malic enzyme [Ornithinibacter sp.]|jgi:malate dehydrogenase (oxaloacetate-decarboxylating)|uniref:NAD(P)-dependent malic enzyme n=1 Tax=Ornithinibacter sp. TaxID=2862748 RepID=UPI001B4C2F48|nr:NADP-dependent malic enzyme [Ornithinibacter sp.]MBP6524663.1 NADP-dependent malic enzyme [Dermatophilaceae bacterium]MBU9943211.1 NADP-dependent malic enzyme [Dermatophilaceae bacterium]HOB79574.1 NADP-dependent malic enzyme [Ornithinibacter sp.]HOT56432.1 NADP-dependent malic enzyme [Ornithinibacter sp.]HPV88877.1 NADP-dependent malic enzyme [Ornithinibacter sp.]
MAASPLVPFVDPESPVFRAHEGGKLGVHATKPLRDRDDLSLLYTPGVAEVSLAIAADPSLSSRYTARGNTVAVISDGTAVLGLGDIGPLGAMPVMEGKAVLFKHFAGIDAVPVVMETGTVDELVDAIARIAPSYGGINLEDISAPRCFDIEEQLKERLDIPVFHDDQHGTAIVVLAGLLNAVRVLDRRLPEQRVVVSGAGAAGVAVTKLLQRAGVRDVVVCDSRGIISPSRQDLTGHKSRLAASTNPRGLSGRISTALTGADVYIGVSGGTVPEDEVALMAPGGMIFALANPTPEVHPDVAHRHAAIVATGRSDFPNQINNVLAFPGIFRGALDSGAPRITEAMKLAAAHAIADLVEEPSAECIVPSVFQEGVTDSVASAVVALARSGR